MLLQRVPVSAPGVQTAEKGADARDTAPVQEKRHPGAGRLIRSRAVEDDVAVARDLAVTVLDVLG